MTTAGDPARLEFELTATELEGDLPLVCARTGEQTDGMVGVWFARSARWTWIPLAAVIALAIGRGDGRLLTSYWAVGGVVLPLVFSRGVRGRLPLDATLRQRQASLRSRRLRTILTALLLTWVAVGLWLLDSRAAGVVVLGAVLALYAAALGMAWVSRRLGARGRPTPEGGVRLINAHPGFVEAVELRRTGHRP
ncbi:hypothetical protein [Euzebya tangerina]|uniref:hypothetical protein n=1 Tax=Euzebya tangerina TaxID=591198 RepID=UPI000E31A348|nr:hypothetical protein [Euzebya tangerina]